jgi:hypothetical protein
MPKMNIKNIVYNKRVSFQEFPNLRSKSCASLSARWQDIFLKAKVISRLIAKTQIDQYVMSEFGANLFCGRAVAL